jgi:hypothetical protein
MRRVIMLVTLVGAGALTIGCDDKSATTGGTGVTSGSKPAAPPVPPPPPPPPNK